MKSFKSKLEVSINNVCTTENLQLWLIWLPVLSVFSSQKAPADCFSSFTASCSCWSPKRTTSGRSSGFSRTSFSWIRTTKSTSAASWRFASRLLALSLELWEHLRIWWFLCFYSATLCWWTRSRWALRTELDTSGETFLGWAGEAVETTTFLSVMTSALFY